ncbi:MAG: hypothetical protein IT240_01960 [Bacteroidia bacterium]|nr:hypothetical protein [Bacteroidia bacterium]
MFRSFLYQFPLVVDLLPCGQVYSFDCLLKSISDLLNAGLGAIEAEDISGIATYTFSKIKV